MYFQLQFFLVNESSLSGFLSLSAVIRKLEQLRSYVKVERMYSNQNVIKTTKDVVPCGWIKKVSKVVIVVDLVPCYQDGVPILEVQIGYLILLYTDKVMEPGIVTCVQRMIVAMMVTFDKSDFVCFNFSCTQTCFLNVILKLW